MKRRYVKYSSNNSGGYWWLTDEDWRNLEAAGWVVDWVKDGSGYRGRDKDDPTRFLGALATSAKRYDVREPNAIAEWTAITGQDPDEEGCPCCGQPHSFYAGYDEKED